MDSLLMDFKKQKNLRLLESCFVNVSVFSSVQTTILQAACWLSATL